VFSLPPFAGQLLGQFPISGNGRDRQWIGIAVNADSFRHGDRFGRIGLSGFTGKPVYWIKYLSQALFFPSGGLTAEVSDPITLVFGFAWVTLAGRD